MNIVKCGIIGNNIAVINVSIFTLMCNINDLPSENKEFIIIIIIVSSHLLF